MVFIKPNQATGLGRGLGALMGDEAVRAAESGDITLRIGEIEPNADQPRKLFREEALSELAESLKTHGVLQPLTVRRLPSGFYQIIDGERRWRAARLSGLSELPVRIIEADDRAAAEMALIHNLQREDLAPLEEAHGYRRLINEYGLTQEEAATRVGKSRAAVANAVRLLALPLPVQALLQEGTLTAGHARALLALPGDRMQERAAAQVVNGRLSVRQTEALVKRLLGEGRKKPKQPSEADRQIAALQQELCQSLSRKVVIKHGARKGKIELEYYDLDDLDALLALLTANRENQ